MQRHEIRCTHWGKLLLTYLRATLTSLYIIYHSLVDDVQDVDMTQSVMDESVLFDYNDAWHEVAFIYHHRVHFRSSFFVSARRPVFVTIDFSLSFSRRDIN